MVTEGLYFNRESEHCGNGHVRMMFIDVLTRRFLLRTNVILGMIGKGENRQAKMIEFMVRPFEKFETLSWLPEEFLATTFMEDPQHMNRIDYAIRMYLIAFDQKQPELPSN